MPYSINLIAWRDNLRLENKRRFTSLIVFGLVLAGIAQWSAGMYIQQQKDIQQARLNTLNSHIKVLDEKLSRLKIAKQDHDSIMTRLSKVESLQKGRNKTTIFMNMMPQLIPEGVYVDKIKMDGLDFEVTGISDSTAHLAAMLDRLENEPRLVNVEMHSIIHKQKRFNKEFQKFNVSFQFVPEAVELALNEPQGGNNG